MKDEYTHSDGGSDAEREITKTPEDSDAAEPEEEQTDPAEEAQTDPAEEAQTDPAEQTQTDPAEQTQTDPAEEAQTDPAEQADAGDRKKELRCPQCAALINEDQVFCNDCGASLQRVCRACGAKLKPGKTFCTSCGQRADGMPQANEFGNTPYGYPAPNTYNNIPNQPYRPYGTPVQYNMPAAQSSGRKKTVVGICVGVGVVIAAAILIFTVFLNPQRYLEKGDYATAYKVARASDKENIILENITAVISGKCVSSLKDSGSFELRDAWISLSGDSRIILLKVAANNSYGNKVINYWHYYYDSDKGEYSLLASYSDFTEEKRYSWDSTDRALEKLLRNAARLIDADFLSGKKGVNLSSTSVSNINRLYDAGRLSSVTLLDVDLPQIN